MGIPIDLYLGFDKNFFHSVSDDTSGRNAKVEIAEYARRYSVLLTASSDLVNSVLDNCSQPEALRGDFFKELNMLAGVECGHSEGRNKSLDPNELLNQYGFTSLSDSQKAYLEGKTGSHFVRLMAPEMYSQEMILFRYPNLRNKRFSNGFCLNFGRDFIGFLKDHQPNRDEAWRIQDRIGSEGEGVFTFWTIAPYVYDDLRQRGKNRDESFRIMFDWVLSSEEGTGFKPRYASFYDFGFYRFGEPLGFDERMPTHLRSRIVSKVVSSRLASE